MPAQPLRPTIKHGDINWKIALCRSGKFDPNLWFDDDSEQAAVAVCEGGGPHGLPCPIKEQCKQFALDTNERSGVWGGLTEQQRKVIAWPKTRVRCPGCRGKNVESLKPSHETCFSCGLSWRV